MENSKFEILTQEQEKHFTDFLNLRGNDRIIFSGIFGIGKTHFLNSYFKDNNKFVALHLYPTNYSVASNEDIFEYIKYDILYEILDKGIHLEKIELSSGDIVGALTPEQAYKIFKSFIQVIPKIGHDVGDILTACETVTETIEEIKKKLKIDDAKDIEDYHTSIELQKGSIYENDFYTKLIGKLIKQIKEKHQKEVILIVDDLDRIDPEHIFRIINIFAVHFDANRSNENKFGLDRILLSCDINNVRELFRHKFGGSVDFNGYIDKFYSREIYMFDSRKSINAYVNKLLDSIEVGEEIELRKKVPWKYFSKEQEFLVYLLASLIYDNKLNLRSLKKIFQEKYTPIEYKVYLGKEKNFERYNYELPLLCCFDLLCFILGSKEGLSSATSMLDFKDYRETHDSVFYGLANFSFHLHDNLPNLSSDSTYQKSHEFRTIELNFGITFNITKLNVEIEKSNLVYAMTNSQLSVDDFKKLFYRMIQYYVDKVRGNFLS